MYIIDIMYNCTAGIKAMLMRDYDAVRRCVSKKSMEKERLICAAVEFRDLPTLDIFYENDRYVLLEYLTGYIGCRVMRMSDDIVMRYISPDMFVDDGEFKMHHVRLFLAEIMVNGSSHLIKHCLCNRPNIHKHTANIFPEVFHRERWRSAVYILSIGCPVGSIMMEIASRKHLDVAIIHRGSAYETARFHKSYLLDKATTARIKRAISICVPNYEEKISICHVHHAYMTLITRVARDYPTDVAIVTVFFDGYAIMDTHAR